MRLKSYFASTVDAAMHQARLELGEDAMLLDSRQAPAEARHLGSCEVVFALPETAPETPAATGPAQAKGPARQYSDLAELRRELDRVRNSVERSSSLAAATAGLLHDPEVSRCYSELVAADILPEIVQELVVACAASTTPGSRGHDRLRAAVFDEISRRLHVLPQAGLPSRNQSSNPAVCVVGPPGAGKTSSLVKLAITQGLPSRKPQLLVSLDNLRVGAGDALMHYATLIGAAFLVADSSRPLAQIVAEHRHRYWIWIDTPGFGPREADAIAELADQVRAIPEMDCHLVLSAAMKSSDLRVAVARFAPFGPKKLLFAHLDETDTYGGILSAQSASDLPVSFLCAGHQIPEAIEPASIRRLLVLLAETGASAAVLAQVGRAAAAQ
ncbi:MAG: hypothetical protein JNK48_16880 [Bryobacterales bacterium]|nr:hypothetical protein [Bryobacterales bacterium]